MFQLSTPANPEEYKANAGQTVLLDGEPFRLFTERVDTKSGSWEKGFKFGSITYGVLRREIKPKRGSYQIAEFSCDHGVTWHPSVKLAKKSKNKVIVARSTPTGELAFNSIQKLNRDYYGPGYKWKP